MDAKSNVVKSKSSNSAITNRSEHREKKSRSNAEFQKNVLKKRGVYVEKKSQARQTEANITQDQPIKAPPRPRPGRKKFLASVLTILAKTSTGTQYPDSNDPKDLKKGTKRTVRRRDETINNATATDNRKKPKYRSKVLNNEIGRDLKGEKIVVLQSRKDITQTPSNYSENESSNCSNLPLLALKKGLNDVNNLSVGDDNINVDDNINIDDINIVTNSLVREVMEGKRMKKERRVRIEDPVTLVGVTDYKALKETASDNKGLYNFIVDLLETTMSVYNVKAEYDKSPEQNASATKIPFEIEEAVVKKLKVETVDNGKESRCHSPSPSNRFFCFKDGEGVCTSQYSPSATVIAAPTKSSPKKKQIKARSTAILRKPKPNRINTESVIMNNRKATTRKQRKENLINLFKEQLSMEDYDYEEPQNLYEALKVIANNKRRCQKTLHFEERARRNHTDYGFPECEFKSPKVISTGRKKKGKKSISGSLVNNAPLEIEAFDRKSNSFDAAEDEEYGSEHSLQVYGYDYEKPLPIIEHPKQRATEIVFTYHSSPSLTDQENSREDLLEYTDSVFNSFSRSSSVRNYLK